MSQSVSGSRALNDRLASSLFFFFCHAAIGSHVPQVYHVMLRLSGPAAGTKGTFLSTRELRSCNFPPADCFKPAGGCQARSFAVVVVVASEDMR